MGRKSLNLAQLRHKLLLPSSSADSGQQVGVPSCVTLPFGSFERALEANPDVGRKVGREISRIRICTPGRLDLMVRI